MPSMLSTHSTQTHRPLARLSVPRATADGRSSRPARTTGFGRYCGAAVPPATEHNGMLVSPDSANTAVIYLLLGPGTASAGQLAHRTSRRSGLGRHHRRHRVAWRDQRIQRCGGQARVAIS